MVLGIGALGQTVHITGVIQDPNGTPYESCQGTARLVSGNGSGAQSWTYNQTNPVNPVRPIAGCDSYGAFTIDVMNTSLIDQQSADPVWVFSFCSDQAIVPQLCFNVPGLALTSDQS